MMTLVISLRELKARRQKIAELLQAAGLSYRIVDAILGSSLPEFANGNGPCALHGALWPRPWPEKSHKLALEAFLSSDDSIALILEDDAVVPCNLFEAIGALATTVCSHAYVTSRMGGCHSAPKCDAPGQISLRQLPSGRAVAGRVGLTQDRRNWRRAGTAITFAT